MSDLLAVYRAAVEEHNRTRLATEFGHYVRPSRYQLIQAQVVAEHLPPNGFYLDIGTGSCIVPRVIRKLGHRAVTADSPDAAGDDAMAEARAAGVETVAAHVGRDRLPFPDQSFDVISAFDVIEHIPDSPKPFLAELRRVLKPGGILLIGTPNAVRLTTRIKVALGYSNWPAVSDYLHEDKNWGHHHEYTFGELADVVNACGYRTISVASIEARLGQVRISRLSEIKTQARKESATGRMTTLTAASAFLWFVTWVIPKLRSEMLLLATPATA